MKSRVQGLASVLVAVCLVVALPVSAAEDLPAQTVTGEMRCPVCGMYPARYPKWMVQVVFKDRSLSAFDSPLDFFRFRKNMARHDSRHGDKDVGAVYFSDYAKGGWIESKKAFFASGSDAKGPMINADFPAFGSKELAEEFVRAHGGKVLTFDQAILDAAREMAGEHNHDQHGHHEYH